MVQRIESTEMYLRTVLEFEEEGVRPLRARIAERLGLSAPAVSEAVERLRSHGLLRLDHDRTVRLTVKGRKAATSVMRKHRLAERFLVDVIGLDLAYAHEEACRWEHVISDLAEQKLVELLGDPQFSPFGNPIPGAGPVARRRSVLLAEVEDGTVRLRSYAEALQSDSDMIGVLFAAGMRPGEVVEVTWKTNGVELAREGRQVVLSEEAAELVFVQSP